MKRCQGRIEEFMKRRMVAWMLTFVMVLSLVMVPAGKVQAADDLLLSLKEGTSIPTEANSKNKAEIHFAPDTSYSTLKALSDAGYTKLRVSVNLSSYATVAEEDAGVMPFLYYGETWTNNDVWYNLTETGVQSFELDLSKISTTSTETISHFGIQISGVTGSISLSDVKAELITSGVSSEGENDFGTTRQYSEGMTATITNQETPTNAWSGFDVALTNNTGSSICDWIVVLNLPSGAGSNFKCWNATFVADGDTIYLYPMNDGGNAVMTSASLSGYAPGFGISGMLVNANQITVEKVYFNKGSSSTIDYSSGETNDNNPGGNTPSVSDGQKLTDTSKKLNAGAEINYAKLLQELLYFYDANMCGSQVSENCGLGWRNDCHTYDKDVQYNGVTVDVDGGFHDAGDHVKFGQPQGYSATVLALSYYQFGEAFDELEQTEHYQKIMDHFCDYFVNSTVYSGTSVQAFCYQVGNGNTDHGYWGAPESQTYSQRGEAYFADSSNPAIDEVSVAIAALALHAKNFPNSLKSATYLQTAKDLFAFAQSNYKDNDDSMKATKGASGFYNSSSYVDDYCSAAAALYVATGEAAYKDVYTTKFVSPNTGWPLDWDNTWAVAALLMGDWSTVYAIASQGTTVTSDGFKLIKEWGSARYNTSSQFLGLSYDKAKDKFSVEDGCFAQWATGQMNYLLGNNTKKQNFIVGYNEFSSKWPHHRAASRSSDASATRDDHYTLLGALVGGPTDTSDSYNDSQNDYTANEVALDYNAGAVGAAAGLYLLHKNDDTIATTLTTSEELSAIGVTTYYGADSSSVVTEVILNQTTLELNKGETASLTATVTTSDKSTVDAEWSSSDESVATVDAEGEVTAVAGGTATITAKAGTKKATCDVTVTKKAQQIPTVTYTVDSRTANSFALETTVENILNDHTLEYSIDDGATWSDAPTFSGLQPFTAYTVCARAKETDTYEASEKAAEKLTVYTLVSDPYSIDVSKLANSNGLAEVEQYVDALRTEKGTQTISYDATTKELTLMDATKEYMLVGNNSELTVEAPVSNVVLDDVTMKKLDVTNVNASSDDAMNIRVNGTSKVNSVVSNSDQIVNITGTGTLDTTNIIVVDTVTFDGVNVIVDASGTDNAAISMGKINISAGEVTAIGDSGWAAILGNEINITGGTVTATGGTGASAITGDNIVVDNASVTATGGKGGSAIEVMDTEGKLTIKDANVTVNVDEESQNSPIHADNIILIGDNKITSESGAKEIYSSVPKDENGNEIKIKVTNITLNATAKTINVGDTITLTKTVTPANAADTSVTWKSSNVSVATVDQHGKVVGLTTGTTVITVTANDGSGKSASCTVTVQAKVTEDATDKDTTTGSDTSKDTVVDSDANKDITTGNDADEDAGTDVDKDTSGNEGIAVEKVKITGATKKVAPGKKIKLTATVYPENATNTKVTWKVSNAKYASVNSKGVVTAKKAGKGKEVTVIAYSAEDNSIKATYKISIMKNPVKKIKLSAKTKTIKKGKSVTVKATFTPNKGISKDLTWISSNKKIATVDSKGKVTGKKKGTVKITAKAKDGSGKKVTIRIRVK